MTSDSDKLLTAKLSDMLERSERHCIPVYSDFLDERQIHFVNNCLRKIPYHDFTFYGGYENAQRKILCVHSPFFVPEPEDFPLSILQFSYRKSDILTHRDILGAVMSCRIRREKTGDILISDGIAQVFVYCSVTEFLANEISSVGRTSVKISIAEKCSIQPVQKYSDIKGTVASLRLDCIISLAVRKSREKTVQIIKKDGVELNFSTVFSPSVQLKENDVFSIRGYGKFILQEVSGISSKGRIHVLIKKFI